MSPDPDEWVECTTIGDSMQGLRRYLSVMPPYGRELVTDRKGNTQVADKKTQGASIHERKSAVLPHEQALLAELDRLVEQRNKQEGLVGNLEGAYRKAGEALQAARQRLTLLETRATRVRRSYEALHEGETDMERHDRTHPTIAGQLDNVLGPVDGAETAVQDEAEAHRTEASLA